MDNIRKGKKYLIAIIVTILLIDIATTIFISSIYASFDRMDKASYQLLQGIFRLLLTCLLLLFLYKGHNWSKWIIVILLGLGGVYSLIGSGFNIILIILGIVYLFISITLVVSKKIKSFMSFQRDGVVTDSET